MAEGWAASSTQVAGTPAMAQQTATPLPQGYRGATQSETYQGAFADLANEISAYWEATFRDEEGHRTNRQT